MHGEVTRVYLVEEDAALSRRRKKLGGACDAHTRVRVYKPSFLERLSVCPLHTSAYPLAQTHTHTHTARERTDTRTLTHSHVHIATGNKNKSYTEGWVEFADKKVAKVRFMLQSYVSRLPRREGQPVEVAVSKRERTQDAHIHALFAHRPWQDLAITRTCAQAHTPLSPPPPLPNPGGESVFESLEDGAHIHTKSRS